MVQLRWKRFLRWRRAAIVLVMALLTVVPLVGSIRMAKALQRSQSYVIAKDQWETYSFIAENLPDKAKVLAVDLADLQLLPVYTSADLVVSGISYGSSTPEIELNKYIQTLKLIGIPMSLMQNWLEMMAITAPRFRCAPTLLRPKWEEMEGALLLEHLIYYPNVNQFKGRPIRAENGAELSRDFKLLIPQLLSQPLERDRLIDETDYLLISSRFAARRRDPNADILGFSPVYKNGWHTLYKRTRTN